MHHLWCYHNVRECKVFNLKNTGFMVNYILLYSQSKDFRLVRAKSSSEITVPSGGLYKVGQGDVETGGHENLVLFMG